MKYKISEGKIDEFDRFYKFFEKSLREQFPEFTEDSINYYLEIGYSEKILKKFLEEEKRSIFLARDPKNNIVGYLLTLQDWGGVNCALWMGVEKEHQERGIASKFLEIWEKSALKGKNHALLLYSAEKNRKFYKNRGFNESGKLPEFWFGVDAYVFYKKIGPAEEKNYLFDYLKNKKLNHK